MDNLHDGGAVALASELRAAAEALAGRAEAIDRPSDSDDVLTALAAAQDALAVTYRRLASWHGRVIAGVHHATLETGSDVENRWWMQAETLLNDASTTASAAAASLAAARNATSVAEWFDELRDDS